VRPYLRKKLITKNELQSGSIKECLPIKSKALSSNSSVAIKKKYIYICIFIFLYILYLYTNILAKARKCSTLQLQREHGPVTP
jgi:hypothetical protein